MKAFALLVAATALLSGCLCSACKPWNMTTAPAGHAIIRTHLIEQGALDPKAPAASPLDFTLLEVDGGPVVLETIPASVDLQRGALVTAGTHRFKARAQPHLLPAGYKPREIQFELTVEEGKVYELVDRNGQPTAIESHPKP